METKIEFESPAEEAMIENNPPKRSYWEFGIFIAVLVILVAVVGTLIFVIAKSFSDPNKGKASIQEMALEKNQVPDSEAPKAEEKTEKALQPAEDKDLTAKTINPLEVSIKILNGGAVSGSAGKVKELLLSKGYQKVEAGNAEKSTYLGVIVFYQTGEKEAAEKIAADLKVKYSTVQTKAGTSSEEKSAPVVIILGK